MKGSEGKIKRAGTRKSYKVQRIWVYITRITTIGTLAANAKKIKRRQIKQQQPILELSESMHFAYAQISTGLEWSTRSFALPQYRKSCTSWLDAIILMLHCRIQSIKPHVVLPFTQLLNGCKAVDWCFMYKRMNAEMTEHSRESWTILSQKQRHTRSEKCTMWRARIIWIQINDCAQNEKLKKREEESVSRI